MRFELTPSKRISFPQCLLVALFNKVAGIRVNHSTKASCLIFQAKRERYIALHIVSTLKLIFNAKQLIPRRSSDVAIEIGPVKLQLAYTDEELSLIAAADERRELHDDVKVAKLHVGVWTREQACSMIPDCLDLHCILSLSSAFCPSVKTLASFDM